MKICVTATGDTFDAAIDPRFGRAPYFMIVDSEDMSFEAVNNTAAGAMSGTGIQAAQTVASKGAKLVITGNVGPNAFQALSSAEIKIVVGAHGTLVLTVVLALLISRFWCRYLYPMGAIAGVFNKVSLVNIDLDEGRCEECFVCLEACGMGITELEDIGNSTDCILCGRCVEDCPEEALRFPDKG